MDSSKNIKTDLKMPHTSSDSEKKHNFTMSHLSIIRMFVIWGILDSLVNMYTLGNRSKSLTTYIIIFLIITFAAYIFPNMINFL